MSTTPSLYHGCKRLRSYHMIVLMYRDDCSCDPVPVRGFRRQRAHSQGRCLDEDLRVSRLCVPPSRLLPPTLSLARKATLRELPLSPGLCSRSVSRAGRLCATRNLSNPPQSFTRPRRSSSFVGVSPSSSFPYSPSSSRSSRFLGFLLGAALICITTVRSGGSVLHDEERAPLVSGSS